jgi:hypothetical protein
MVQAYRANGTRGAILLIVLTIAFALSVAMPNRVQASDGEVVSRGTNVCTEVTKKSSSAAGFSCNNIGDCPVGVDACWVEIKYQTQCEWVWCTTFDDRTGWIRLGVGQDSHSYCVHGKQKWQVLHRVSWVDSNVTTVETWAEPEWMLSAGGEGLYRNVAKFLFNVSANSGTKRGVRISREAGTAHSAPDAGVAITSSGGTWITLSC